MNFSFVLHPLFKEDKKCGLVDCKRTFKYLVTQICQVVIVGPEYNTRVGQTPYVCAEHWVLSVEQDGVRAEDDFLEEEALKAEGENVDATIDKLDAVKRSKIIIKPAAKRKMFIDSGNLSTEDMFEDGGEVIAMDFVAVIDESNAASVVS